VELAPCAVLSDAGLAPSEKSAVDPQPETVLPTKQMERMACSSMPLGAMPVCPCGMSKKPAPSMLTGRLAVWKLVDAVSLASKAVRAAWMRPAHGPPETQLGEGISEIMVVPAVS